VVHRFAELIAPSRLGRSFRWLERHVRLGVIMRGGLIIETLTHLALALTRWAWFALIVFVIFGAHAFIWGTTSTSVRQRAVPAQFQGRVGSVYLTGVVGGMVIRRSGLTAARQGPASAFASRWLTAMRRSPEGRTVASLSPRPGH
jgi:hypothetical protein